MNLNAEFKFWTWTLNLNFEFKLWPWILNLNFEFKFEYKFWIEILNDQ